MERVVLGLDIGGANLKAATSAGRALSVPFAVWKQPDALSGELRKLIAKFPEASEIAATMTAELCDCYETKREGVRRIVDDLANATKLPIRIWSTEGKFVTPKAAKANHMKVAAANWHALATYCGRLVQKGPAILIDIGTTTTDIIPILNGIPINIGLTDRERIMQDELYYCGWRRTPALSLLGNYTYASEFFATTLDAYLVLNLVEENPKDCDTADGRPATRECAKARLARMECGDCESMSESEIGFIAETITLFQLSRLNDKVITQQKRIAKRTKKGIQVITSGSGEFLFDVMNKRGPWPINRIKFRTFKSRLSLNETLGKQLAASAPAYAVSILSLHLS